MDCSALAPTRSLSGWFRHLSTGILFPGPSSASHEPVRLTSLLLLVVLPGVLLYPCLGFYLFEPDESRYAQIPREMLERGEWVVPTLQGEPYLDKPPLFYWGVMLAYRMFGYHDWAARLVPALALHATLLVTYLLGRRSLGERAALVAALVLTLAPGFLGMSRLLILDGLLTLCLTTAGLAAFEATRHAQPSRCWWLISAFACGLGVLTKGPVALLLVLPPSWLFGRLTGSGWRPGWRAWLVFVGVVLAIALPWYVALSLRMPGFATYFFWTHNLERFLAPGIHVRGVWFYVPILWLTLFPATLLLVPLGRFLLSGAEDVARQRGPELGFHLLAGCWCVFFFTLSSCKLPTYVLPAIPSFALVVGCFLTRSGWDTTRLARGTALASLALILLLHHLGLPWYARYRSPMSRPAEVLALCAEPATSVVCYPRNCDSIAFYLGRSDLRTYRSKDIEDLRTLVRRQPRTVILCTHRHSLRGLKELLPPEVRVIKEVRMGLADIPGVTRGMMHLLAKGMGETALGLSDLAVVERVPGPTAASVRR